MTRVALKSLLLCLAGVSAWPAMAQWTGINLGPAGAGNSYAYCATGNRQGGYATVGGQFHAGVWSGTAASWVDMHPLTVTSSRVLGMHSGSQVGYTAIGSAVRAAMWSGSAGSWVDLNPEGVPSSAAYGVFGATQVGRIRVGGVDHACVWGSTAASYTDLNPSTVANSSYALAINGFFIVGYANMISPVTSHAALWIGTASSFLDLNPAGATASYCYGVADGQQVGYAHIGGQQHAGVWAGTAASWVDLNPAGMTSRAYAVSGGQQVGYTTAIDGTPHAALWSGTAGSWVDLHAFVPTNYPWSYAQGIWNDGAFTYVVGYVTNASVNPVSAFLWKKANACYANCDGSATAPILTANDFVCFVNGYVSGQSFANCDGSSGSPTLTANDFVCFVNSFMTGCP